VRASLQRRCACGGSPDRKGKCAACSATAQKVAPPLVHDVLRSPGRSLEPTVRSGMEAGLGSDFSHVRVHTDSRAAESAHALGAAAYTVGRHVVFGRGGYVPRTVAGRHLLAHELTHVLQQRESGESHGALAVDAATSAAEQEAHRLGGIVATGGRAVPATRGPVAVQRAPEPYVKTVTVHLTPPQSAELQWEGTPPPEAAGTDSFTVSTGKGYSNPEDPAGTCTRDCCSDPDKQCAPPWNNPGRVGACCTYYGKGFWTGRPSAEHNGWKYWTPIQPHYSTRGIALHQHPEVTGQPIGHGCVRMNEPNAQRIYEHARPGHTQVNIDGRAAPVACDDSRRCGARASAEQGAGDTRLASTEIVPIPGLEGERS
jgi:hypothetical protein